MHYKKVKNILSANNGLNIYRGCEHNCIYCDSRSKCYNMDHDFNDIEIKENSLELLEDELKRKRKKVIISTGSMSDPYMPIEKDLKYTRKMLELIYKYGHGVHIITKSDLILRDFDLLKKINKQAKTRISITLTTYDENTCKIIEPNVCTTNKRFEVLKKLNEEKIETYVWLCPILPYINDSLDNLRCILNMCKEANVKGIVCFGFGLTLREGSREYFYDMLDKYFPNLKKQYIKEFQNGYSCMSKYNKYLYDYFLKFCKENNIMCNNDEIFKELSKLYEEEHFEQLSLF